jgi:hypothetical protein
MLQDKLSGTLEQERDMKSMKRNTKLSVGKDTHFWKFVFTIYQLLSIRFSKKQAQICAEGCEGGSPWDH